MGKLQDKVAGASGDSSFVTRQAIAVDGGLSCEADSRMRGMSLTGSLQGS